MNDYDACADFCDDLGFSRQATMLRAAGRGELRAYAVCERAIYERARSQLGIDFEPAIYARYARANRVYGVDDYGGIARALFLSRDDAEDEARRREVLSFRECNLYEYCNDEGLGWITEYNDDGLRQEFAAILGDHYTLPNPDGHQGSLFPSDTTDEQIRALILLFEIRFFYVAEIDFMVRANPRPWSEPLS